MVSSDELVRDIHRLDSLITAMANAYPWDAEDIADLLWMRSTRATLRSLLEIRRTEQRNKVIRIDVWRDGGRTPRTGNREAA